MSNAGAVRYPLDEAIAGRRSVRGFLPRPVSREVLAEVLALAQHAPSNCNVQPWRVYIASGEQILCGLSFGYEDPDVPANRTRQPRAPVEENVVFVG